MNQISITTIVLVSTAALTMAFGQTKMTEADAVRIALENNYTILVAQNSNQIAENNRQLGTAGFLPKLNASGGWQWSKSSQETNSPFSFGNSVNKNLSGLLSLDWTIFDGFTMFVNRDRFNDLAKMNTFQTQSTIEATLISVLKEYYNVIQQELLLKVAADKLRISKDRMDQSKLRGELGSFSSSDVLNAQVAFNNDRSALLRQEIQVESAKRSFNIALGRDPESELNLDNKIPITPLDLSAEELIERTMQNNQDLNAARLTIQVAEHDIDNSQAGYMPRVSAGATYGLTDRLTNSDSERFTEDIKTTSTDITAGLTLSWNLFNGNRDNVAIQNARLEKRNREHQLQNLNKQISAQIYNLVTTLKKQMQILEIESENQLAAKRNLELFQERFKLGAATSLEFRDAQVNYYRAQNAYITARYQARLTRIQIDRLSGNLKLN